MQDITFEMVIDTMDVKFDDIHKLVDNHKQARRFSVDLHSVSLRNGSTKKHVLKCFDKRIYAQKQKNNRRKLKTKQLIE